MHASFEITLEELGKSCASIDVEIEYRAYPGEERTWDYPGSPPYAEMLSVRVLNIVVGEFEYSRAERLDWFEFLDKIVEIIVYNQWDKHEPDALQDANDRLEAAEEAAWESRMGY